MWSDYQVLTMPRNRPRRSHSEIPFLFGQAGIFMGDERGRAAFCQRQTRDPQFTPDGGGGLIPLQPLCHIWLDLDLVYFRSNCL